MLKLIALVLVASIATVSCTATTDYSVVVKPAAYLVSKDVVTKHPSSAKKLTQIADGLDVLAGLAKKDLQLNDFVQVVKNVDQDPEWAVVASYLYDIYRDNVTVNASVEKAANIVRAIAQGIRDSIQVATPSK